MTSKREHHRRGTAGAAVAIGAVLAVGAVISHRQSRRAEETHSPAGRFVEVDGVRLHYLEKGSGTPVVMIHGTGVTAEDYVASGLMDRLSDRYRVIAFDRPGYGYSERPRGRAWTTQAQAELLRKACVALGVGPLLVVGHSWGTLVALEMALRFPVSGLVLLSGYYFPTPRVDSLLLAVPAIPVLGQIIRHTISPLVGRPLTRRMIRRMFAPAPVPDAFYEALPLTFMLRPSQLHASAQDAGRMVPTAAKLASHYEELQMPVIILAADSDGIVKPSGQSMRLKDRLKRGELEVIPDAGHMLHYSHADRVSEAVDRVASISIPVPT